MPYHNAKPGRAVVRCRICQGLGNPSHMLELVHGAGTAYEHGRCFIELNGTPAFLALPDAQTGRLELDDIGLPIAKALLADRAAALLAKRAVEALMSNGVLAMLSAPGASGGIVRPRK